METGQESIFPVVVDFANTTKVDIAATSDSVTGKRLRDQMAKFESVDSIRDQAHSKGVRSLHKNNRKKQKLAAFFAPKASSSK